MTLHALLPDGTPKGNRDALSDGDLIVTDNPAYGWDVHLLLAAGGAVVAAPAGVLLLRAHHPFLTAVTAGVVCAWPWAAAAVSNRRDRRRVASGRYVQIVRPAADRLKETRRAARRAVLAAERPGSENAHLADLAYDTYRQALRDLAVWGPTEVTALQVEADVAALPAGDPGRSAAQTLAAGHRAAADRLRIPVDAAAAQLDTTASELVSFRAALQARARLALQTPAVDPDDLSALPPGPDTLTGQVHALRAARKALNV